MGARSILLAAVALALGGCASSEYGYAYCYDPYRGPVGYYTGPFEPKPACARSAASAAQAAYFVGPHENGYRGAYVSGPYFAPAATAQPTVPAQAADGSPP
ncbi:MAG: hypothetical protein ACOY5Y_10765 [Pseudomonadota bacterium]|jgi:hypothetical protein